MDDLMKKVALLVVAYAQAHRLARVVVGRNVDWKQGVNLGAKQNQSVAVVPHATLLAALRTASCPARRLPSWAPSLDSLRSWACRLTPLCRIAFAGAAADEERPQILVAKTGDEARAALVREEGAGPRRGGRSGLLDCPADDQIHVDPLAGAARSRRT